MTSNEYESDHSDEDNMYLNTFNNCIEDDEMYLPTDMETTPDYLSEDSSFHPSNTTYDVEYIKTSTQTSFAELQDSISFKFEDFEEGNVAKLNGLLAPELPKLVDGLPRNYFASSLHCLMHCSGLDEVVLKEYVHQ